MKRIDRQALRRAFDLARQHDEQHRAQIDAKLEDGEPWESIAAFAAYCCQMRSLGLKPWQAPPCQCDGIISPENSYGGCVEEVSLLQRMLKAGISRYEPEPLAALEIAEAKAASTP